MDLPTSADDVLAQRTRAELFAQLGELRRPATTDELAKRVGLHPNGVRAHLERMQQAGLVTRARERRPRGRPRDIWSLRPDALPGGDPPTAFADLARWLVRLLAADGGRLAEIEAAGRGIGRELAPANGDGDREARMHGVLVALGFQPARAADAARRRLTYTLRNCPYRDAVREGPPVVCTLHRGLTLGLLDAIAPETELAAFVPRDPDAAGCLIELRHGLAEDVAAPTVSGQAPA